jgi:hypothetical protein
LDVAEKERGSYIPSSASVTSSQAVLPRKSAIGGCILVRWIFEGLWQVLGLWDFGFGSCWWRWKFFFSALQLDEITGPRAMRGFAFEGTRERKRRERL